MIRWLYTRFRPPRTSNAQIESEMETLRNASQALTSATDQLLKTISEVQEKLLDQPTKTSSNGVDRKWESY